MAYNPYVLITQQPERTPRVVRSTKLFADAMDLGDAALLLDGASRAWIRHVGYDDNGLLRSRDWEGSVQNREVVWRALPERMGA